MSNAATVQLDHARIVIRERNFLDILDLALRLIRAHLWRLMAALAIGILPAMALNAWLLAAYAEPDFQTGLPMQYLWYMLLLVVWETPLATAPATLYLGQALFQERPEPAKIVQGFWASLPQLLWYQVVLRGATIPLAWMWLFGITFEPLIALLHLLLFLWIFVFAICPYLGEVILLERNPLRRRRGAEMTTYRRTLALHRGAGGDLFGRWMGALSVGAMLFLSLWLSLWAVAGMLLNELRWETTVLTVYYPVALWIVAGYLTVVRFLSYLDLRIRREGWEVELLMRAEGARLAKKS